MRKKIGQQFIKMLALEDSSYPIALHAIRRGRARLAARIPAL